MCVYVCVYVCVPLLCFLPTFPSGRRAATLRQLSRGVPPQHTELAHRSPIASRRVCFEAPASSMWFPKTAGAWHVLDWIGSPHWRCLAVYVGGAPPPYHIDILASTLAACRAHATLPTPDVRQRRPDHGHDCAPICTGVRGAVAAAAVAGGGGRQGHAQRIAAPAGGAHQ